MFCDCAVAYSTQCTWPNSTRPQQHPVSLSPSFSWSVLYQPVYACQHVTPGWCPSLQPLGAFSTQKQSMFAQSFGSRIRGWIVNYSRSACAPQSPPHLPPTLPSDLLLTHLHGNGAGICFLSCVSSASHPHAVPPTPLPPLLFILPPRSIQLKGSWRGSHGQEVLRVHPTGWSSALAVGLLFSAWKEGLEGKCGWFV